MKRSVSGVVLAMVLMLFLLPAAAMAAGDAPWTGDGTRENPYEVSSKEDLIALADAVNAKNDLKGLYFKQTKDIDLQTNEDNPWPVIGHVIGNTPHEFNGVYDGGDFTISGLYVYTWNEDAGLFGHVGPSGVIQRVHVVDCELYNSALYVAGIAGRNEGLVEYCSSSGVIRGGWQYAGGIVGYNFGEISYCYSDCDVLGAQKVGGITGGQNGGTVVNCYFRGYVYASDITRAYAGGIAGENDGDSTIDNCYSDGIVEGFNENAYCGAIAGSNDTGSTVENCFWEKNEENDIPGIGSGMGETKKVEERTSDEFDSGQVAWELAQGTNGDGWGQTLDDGKGDHDKHPHFTQAPDKDYETTAVYRVTLKAPSRGIDETLYVDPDVDLNLDEGKYQLKWPAQWYVVDKNGDGVLDKNGEPLIFKGNVTDHDVDAVGGERILFAGETETVIVTGTYSTDEQTLIFNLDEYVGYEKNGVSAEGRFEYRIASGNEGLNFILSDDGKTLVVPAGTKANEDGYELTVIAHEKAPYIAPLSLGEFDAKDVELDVKVVIKKADPLIVVNPEASTIGFGDTLAKSELTGGKAQHPVTGVQVTGTFTWTNAETIPTVTEAASIGYIVTFTPEDAINYNTAFTHVTLTVNKADSTVVSPPEPLKDTYKGSAQDLIIKEGSVSGGTMKYWLAEDSDAKAPAQDAVFSSTIPSRANAGEYTVWYMVVGDENHNDTKPESVKAIIKPCEVDIAAQTVIYNGSDTFTVTLDGVSGETVVATLTAADKDVASYEYAAAGGDGKYTAELSSANYAVKSADTLTIAPLVAILKWNAPLVFVADGKDHTVNASVSNAIDGDMIELSYKYEPDDKIVNHASGAGDYTAEVMTLSNPNYTLTDAQNTTQAWHIIRENGTVTLSPVEPVVYGERVTLKVTIDAADGAGLAAADGEQVEFYVNGNRVDSAEVIGNTATLVVDAISKNSFCAGSNTAMAVYDKIGDGKDPDIDAVIVFVTPKPIPATLSGETTKVYDGNTAATNLSIAPNPDDICENVGGQKDDVTVTADSYIYNSPNVAQAQTITASNAILSGAQSGNYTLTSAVTDGSIEPKPVGLEWKGITGLVYNGKPVNVNATAIELIPDDTCGVIVEGGQQTKAGNYQAWATGLTNTNYTLPGGNATTQDYTIDKAALYIPEQTVTYNGNTMLVAENVDTGINGETVAVTYITASADAGNYNYNPGDDPDTAGDKTYKARITDPNYTIAGGAILTIEKATPDVTWPTVNKTVYVNDPPLTDGDWTGGSATGVDGNYLFGLFAIEAGENESWQWDAEGTYPFSATFRPADDTNYNEVSGFVKVEVIRRQVASVNPQISIIDKQRGTPQDALDLPDKVRITTADGKSFVVSVTWTGYDPDTLDEQTLMGTLDLTEIENEVKQSNPETKATITVILLPFSVGGVIYTDKTETYSGSPIRHEINGSIEGVTGITYMYRGKDGTTYGPSPNAPTDVGKYAVTATFEMDAEYPRIATATVTLTITPAQPGLTAPVPKQGLKETGKPQELVTPGAAVGGELQYSLSQDGPWSTAIPTGTKAGTYTVWYRVVGDKNYSDIAPRSVTVTIGPNGPDDVPKTGDEMNIALWVGLMILSLAGMVWALSSGRKLKRLG